MMNRLANCHNRFQGEFKKVLCVCSAGLLRSPTAAVVLSQKPFNYNTRACGLSRDYALIILDDVLIEWADEIVCMTSEQHKSLSIEITNKPIISLEIPDNFAYRDAELIRLIKRNYSAYLETLKIEGGS